MTVGDLRRRMSAEEFQSWLAYYAVEPFGEDRADLRAGVIASTMANIHKAKGTPAFTPMDFMLFSEKREAVPAARGDPRPIAERLRDSLAAYTPIPLELMKPRE